MIQRALLLVSFVLLSVAALAEDVTVAFVSIERPPSAGVIVVSMTVTSHLATDLANVRVETKLDRGAQILAGHSDETWSCGDGGTLNTVHCVSATLPAGATVPLTLYIDAQVGRFHLTTRALWPGGAANYVYTNGWVPHDVHVTHDGDSGEGSLRNAIRLANEDCEGLLLPCRVVFDDAMTIRPRTPLPTIWGDVSIDGSGRVTLDGSQVSGGSGLELVGAGWNESRVRGLTIRGFPWDGIHVNRPEGATVTIEECTIEANGSRGVTAEVRTTVSILRNHILRNARSGVFLLGLNANVAENLIEQNGASGVFVGGELYSDAVRRNRIIDNAHWGIAVSRILAAASIQENSIAGNVLGGIDRGLDGSDGDRHEEVTINNAYIPPPRLTEARYDAGTNTTTITGTYFDARDVWGLWSLELFSNPVAEAQGETFLGRTTAENGDFTLVVDGDLRGRFITATGFRQLFLDVFAAGGRWTSEFAEVVQVR